MVSGPWLMQVGLTLDIEALISHNNKTTDS